MPASQCTPLPPCDYKTQQQTPFASSPLRSVFPTLNQSRTRVTAYAYYDENDAVTTILFMLKTNYNAVNKKR